MTATRLLALMALMLAAAIPSTLAAEETAAVRQDSAVDMVEKFMADYDRARIDDARAADAVPDPFTTAALTSGSLSRHPESLAVLANLRDVLGFPKVELSASEAASLDRVIEIFPKLAGQSGRFDHADLEPIVRSLGEDLEQEVSREILRQASTQVQEGSFGESLRRRAVAAHLERHGDAYLQHGMEEARSRVRGGLHDFLHQTGTAAAAPEPAEQRSITLDELKQFAQHAPVLAVIGRRSQERGIPRFTFPNGMSVEDLRAIRAGEPPPNGKLAPRR